MIPFVYLIVAAVVVLPAARFTLIWLLYYRKLRSSIPNDKTERPSDHEYIAERIKEISRRRFKDDP